MNQELVVGKFSKRFEKIDGHKHLAVIDVTEDEKILLALLGIPEEKSIATSITELNGRNLVIWKKGTSERWRLISIYGSVAM